jgi:hypothetical protein
MAAPEDRPDRRPHRAGTAPVFSPGRQHPALVSGDLALTASTLTTGEVTVGSPVGSPDGSWLWAVDQPALGQ